MERSSWTPRPLPPGRRAHDARVAARILLLGTVLTALGLTGLWDGTDPRSAVEDPSRWWFLLPLTAGCAALAFKRVLPLPMLLAGLAVLGLDAALGGSLAVLLVLYDLLHTAALLGGPRLRRVLWTAATAAVVVPAAAVLAEAGDLQRTALTALQQAALCLTPLWWAGDVRRKAELAELAEARADAVEHLAEARRHEAVRAERDALARDLHDVVASHLSAIALRTGGALATAPEAGKDRTSLEHARRSALEAMAEMHTMIGLLRAPDPSDDPAAAGPAELESLLDGARAQGLDVELTDERPVSETDATDPRVGLAVHRILQEALANAAKHAPGCRVRISIGAPEPGRLGMRVLSTRPAAGPGTREAPTGGGWGLTTMQERARSVGGRLQVAADAEHWTVTALLPADPAAEPVVSAGAGR